jgi:UDP-glucose:(heptosyl)LPS alpha-1,3-glucosyltransferase
VRVALVIHHVRPTGGQDRYALELARRLAGACELDLVTIRAEDALPPQVTVRVVRAPDRPLLLTAALFRRGAARILSQGRYDIVHTVGGAFPGASVVTAQFCHAAWRAVRREAGAYQRLVTAQAVRDERRAYRHPNLRAVIAVSQRTAQEVGRHYGPLSVPVTVIPNAVDSARFAPAARRGPTSTNAVPQVLFVGAYERKGLDTAIRAVAAMRTRVELVAVGAGDRARFTALARSLGVADRVRLEPPRRDIAECFREADAFVFPTRYEPFGMVVAEAMASGLPVVTSAAAGAADYVRDGESGYVIPDAEDSAAFARALDRIFADDGSRSKMAGAARAAVAPLTWDWVAERTLAVYRNIL